MKSTFKYVSLCLIILFVLSGCKKDESIIVNVNSAVGYVENMYSRIFNFDISREVDTIYETVIYEKTPGDPSTYDTLTFRICLPAGNYNISQTNPMKILSILQEKITGKINLSDVNPVIIKLVDTDTVSSIYDPSQIDTVEITLAPVLQLIEGLNGEISKCPGTVDANNNVNFEGLLLAIGNQKYTGIYNPSAKTITGTFTGNVKVNYILNYIVNYNNGDVHSGSITSKSASNIQNGTYTFTGIN